MALISVIIPTYGEPIFLEQSINSIISQTLSSWELIVVDDNPPDSLQRKQTESLMEKYKNVDNILYLKHPRNLNGATARNTGLAEASGEYIAFLDSDDEYLPNRLEQCLKAIQGTDGTVAGVYTGCEFRRGGKVYHVENDIESGNFLKEALACTFVFCTGSNIFVKKSVLDELSGFDERFIRHQDYEFLVRLFENYSLLAIREILVIKNNENVNLPNVKRMIEVKELFLSKYNRIIKSLSSKEQHSIYQSHYLQIAEAAIRSKDYHLAKEYYRKAKAEGFIHLKNRARIKALYIKRKING